MKLFENNLVLPAIFPGKMQFHFSYSALIIKAHFGFIRRTGSSPFVNFFLKKKISFNSNRFFGSNTGEDLQVEIVHLPTSKS